MAQVPDAISFSITLTANQHLIVHVSGEPTGEGTNVVVSHAGEFDEGELSMLIADIFGMVIRSIVDPDRRSYKTRPSDFDDTQREDLDTSEIPF